MIGSDKALEMLVLSSLRYSKQYKGDTNLHHPQR